jgi:hypothetical protein
MKQLHTVAAVVLLFPNLALTQNRRLEKSYNIKAMDLAESPGPEANGLIGAGTAFRIIDDICGQVPEGSDPRFEISGAYNMLNGGFMTWEQYMSGVGQNGNPEFYWASGPWHTFKGTCSLKPLSSWVKHSSISQGEWVPNTGDRDTAIRMSPILIILPGFRTETSVSSWRSRCKNVDEMAETFRAMGELPQDLKDIWKGLDRRVASHQLHIQEIQVPFGHEGRAMAATMALVVQAQLVLHVKEWYWYYEPAISGVASGWQGMGGLWNSVYSKDAWVRAEGLVQQMAAGNPQDDARRPFWWYCVSLAPWNTQIRRYI